MGSFADVNSSGRAALLVFSGSNFCQSVNRAVPSARRSRSQFQVCDREGAITHTRGTRALSTTAETKTLSPTPLSPRACGRGQMNAAQDPRDGTAPWVQRAIQKQKRPVRFFQTGRFERKVFPNYGAGFSTRFDVLSQPSVAGCALLTILYVCDGRVTNVAVALV